MALSQSERIQISGDQVDIPKKIQAANDTIADVDAIKAEIAIKDDNLKIFFDKYSNITNAYQNERKYINGTTNSTIINSELISSAKKELNNKFFPNDGSWTNFQPKKHTSVEGLPTTTTNGYELQILNNPIESYGLIALIEFLLNGQTSGVATDSLLNPYTPGDGTMIVTTGNQTPGNLIIAGDSSTSFSGLFLVTNVAGTTLTVTEVIPPEGTLDAITTNIDENITPFTNTERNTITSSNYQNVISNITTFIISTILLWETNLNNQLIELNSNTDSRSPQASEIVAAKASINTSKGIIDTWQALPNTGTTLLDSKFVNINITPIQSQITARLSFTTTRLTQIITALGSVTQNTDGTYIGTGIYYLRFLQIDNRINIAGGPLTEYYEKGIATIALTQIATSAANQGTTFNTELRTEALTENANGTNIVKVSSTTGYSVSNTIYVMADNLTELTGTITNISGLNITLSITIPNTYTIGNRARIYKQL